MDQFASRFRVGVTSLSVRTAIGLGVFAALSSGAWAQGSEVIETVDLSAFPGDIVDEVIVPVPSEIFAVLDKLGQPNWKSEIREQDNATFTDRYDLALQFGVVVADGFIAVQAEDKPAIQKIGHEVLRLSTSLAVKDSVARHAQSILDNAEADDFAAVRDELDRTQRTVREEMHKMRDEELSQCVSIGGWLRGTDVVTSLISKSFSEEKAELLYQPELIEHFEKSIGKMSADVSGSPKMTSIAEGLGAVRKSMLETADGVIPANVVSEIQTTCARLVEMIVAKKDTAETKGKQTKEGK